MFIPCIPSLPTPYSSSCEAVFRRINVLGFPTIWDRLTPPISPASDGPVASNGTQNRQVENQISHCQIADFARVRVLWRQGVEPLNLAGSISSPDSEHYSLVAPNGTVGGDLRAVKGSIALDDIELPPDLWNPVSDWPQVLPTYRFDDYQSGPNTSLLGYESGIDAKTYASSMAVPPTIDPFS